MEEHFFLLLTYKGKTLKFKVVDPTASMGQLMKNLKETGAYDLPSTDPSGAPILYYFAKVQDGKSVILRPKHGKEEMHLYDYDINNGDSLLILYEPIAG